MDAYDNATINMNKIYPYLISLITGATGGSILSYLHLIEVRSKLLVLEKKIHSHEEKEGHDKLQSRLNRIEILLLKDESKIKQPKRH